MTITTILVPTDLLTERLGELEGDTTSAVVFGIPARAIVDAAAQKDADLIVVGTHGTTTDFTYCTDVISRTLCTLCRVAWAKPTRVLIG